MKVQNTQKANLQLFVFLPPLSCHYDTSTPVLHSYVCSVHSLTTPHLATDLQQDQQRRHEDNNLWALYWVSFIPDIL